MYRYKQYSLFSNAVTQLVVCTLAMLAAPLIAIAELQPVTIRIAADHGAAPHPAAITELFFKERLEELIPGSKVQIYTAGALYKIPEAVEAMTDGSLEMTWGQFGKTAQIEPFASIVNGPMLLTTPGAMNELDNMESFKFLAERFSKIHGVKIFGSGHLSMYMGMGSSSRLLKPEDFAGKKIRSMGPAENAALSSWGATPVTMAFGDVPPALQTKVIDGLLTSLGGFNQVKDQAPYFTVAGINGVVGDYYWVGASELWWNSLNEETQQAIETLIVDEVLPFQKAINWCNDKRVLDLYKTEDPSQPGIYVMNAEEQKVLSDLLGNATLDWVKSQTPDEANEWADKFVAEARAASKAHPLDSTELEKTDCSKFAPWFERYTKG